MRSLLIKWSESVLDTPVLFRLGYGGVTAPLADGDQDDVSSWGGSDAEERTREVEDEFFLTQPADEEIQRARFVAEKRPLLRPREASSQGAAAKSKSKRGGMLKEEKVHEHSTEKKLNDDDSSMTQDPDEELLKKNTKKTKMKSTPKKATRKAPPSEVDENVSPPATVVTTPISPNKKRKTEEPAEVYDTEREEEEKPVKPFKRERRRKPVPFSESEVDAIREGVARFGIGYWAEIKLSDPRLAKRDTVQIKDKYRTMLKNNEI
jgi:hypothetical protein